MLIVGQKIIFNRIWRINAKSHPFTHAFLGVRFKVVGRALAWHARGHRFDPGNLHTEALHEKSRSAFYFVSKQVYLPNLDAMIENFDKALSHPDADDLERLKQAVK